MSVLLVWILMYVRVRWLRRNFRGPCVFPSREEVVEYLARDMDGYHRGFQTTDLHARNVASAEEYGRAIREKACIGTFTADEAKRIVDACQRADEFLHTHFEPWFDGKQCCRMTWRIACVDGNVYEDGLPHTRGDLILFPRNYLYKRTVESYTRTLIHEKVHVYQKAYPRDTELYIQAHGFERTGKRHGTLVRSNSDTDDYLYRQSHTQQDFYAMYLSKTPESIHDIVYAGDRTQRYEHPYERMAVDIANWYTDTSTDTSTDTYIKNTNK